MTSHQSYFGIDYGTRKIGVAVGQTLTHTAMGIAVVPVRNGEVEWKELDSLVARWKPDAFVVGMPYNMDGTESDMTAAAQKFARRISERYKKPWRPRNHPRQRRDARQEVQRQIQSRRDGGAVVVGVVVCQCWQCVARSS